MASPRVRRLMKRWRLDQLELAKVQSEVPSDTKLVEVEVRVGDDEPNLVDEVLLDELLEEKKSNEKSYFSNKKKK